MEKPISPINRSDELKSFTRLDALKALAAASGAVAAAAFLPSKWIKPVIQAGVLPAHAQGTLLFDCWLEELIYEDISFQFEFSTIPATPSVAVILEFILDSTSGFLGPIQTQGDGKVLGFGKVTCGGAGMVYRQVWWDATQTQIYCQSGPVTVQPNAQCSGPAAGQSSPSVEIQIDK